ncbi:non-hydrolyzing UDP-N-acetylglucosamine 2-epimerase [Furfurilactobacillus milii]|uniref:UDP-N-acetylglucosamine 2-epimerase (non-hydrolyzing) n=1 Tax=Furfurilactobacillus milii TaxID=2888272 RepID=A0A6N9I5P4_9LACO|nr:UDP-N-acetylglucosamine 2-epimerase (non-hydrolyzing) [Furfurilactobacillus milii]MYV18024.1 UDP-N-acetylglucosamine 2-epimerase (non-hydrolyzing) [Furfurilactobacillus milii]
MSKPLKVMTVFGTRPEAIKMAPIILRMHEDKNFEPITVVTAQHREMLDQVLKIFKITPDYDLNVMKPNQKLDELTARVVTGLTTIISQVNPDIVLVHGDTTTTFTAALACFYNQVPIGHVEAGLRTWDKYSPFPEEMNRQMTDVLADFYFAPTELSKRNLLREHHAATNIFVTGNTAIDALQETVKTDYKHDVLNQIKPGNRVILLTMHRRENLGQPMTNVFQAVKEVVEQHNNVEVIYPVHLSPNVQKVAQRVLGHVDCVHLVEPLDVLDFHNLAAKSDFIMTDSGGVQEEAPSLNKPVLVLRDETERPEGVTAGTLKLIGTDKNNVKKAMIELLTNTDLYSRMAEAKNPYGDGHAAKYILSDIRQYFSEIEKHSGNAERKI